MRITYKRQFGELYIHFLSNALLCILLAVSPSRKKASYAALGEKLQPGQKFVANHQQVLADFENNSVAFDSLSAEATFRLAQNPAPSAVNSSAVCGQILGNGGAFDLYSEQLDYYVDLSRESDLQMRVYTSVKGKLTFTWLGKDAMGAPLPALTGTMNIDKTMNG